MIPHNRIRVELLEDRCCPSAVLPGESPANDTLVEASVLGELAGISPLVVTGTIGDSLAGAADVDWYQFTLDKAARIRLKVSDGSPVLSLYNDDSENYSDPSNPYHHRRLAQTGTSGVPLDLLERNLAAGTYYLAVSGESNRTFQSFLPNSGVEGATGEYSIAVEVEDSVLVGTSSAIVLAVDPAGMIPGDPGVLYITTTGPIDPSSIDVDPYSPSPTLTLSREGMPVALGWATFSSASSEIQFAPLAPLGPGNYEIRLAGDSTQRAMVLLDGNGQPFGSDAQHPLGQDFRYSFTVSGNGAATERGHRSDDSVGTANELGVLGNVHLVRLEGAIGDDAAYDPFSLDPFLLNRGADVDLYHFEVTGQGRSALIAEAWAGRLGSALDPALTLFEVQANGSLRRVGSNDNSGNETRTSNGYLPLFTDSVLFAGLDAGEYYLAVSSSGHLADPANGLDHGDGWVFDPRIPHSGQLGYSTGSYELVVRIQPDDIAPTVVSATVAAPPLPGPPTTVEVRFSEMVDLLQVAGRSSTLVETGTIEAVFAITSDGKEYHPRLLSFDSETNTAVFLFNSPLPAGTSILHLSPRLGLADLAGNPLVGNDPTGEYIIPLHVERIPRGSPGDPLLWNSSEAGNSTEPQVLGVLFPTELTAGVRIRRESAPEVTDSGDAYTFAVLRPGTYVFILRGNGLASSLRPTVVDANGTRVFVNYQRSGIAFAFLEPGVYTLHLDGLTPQAAPQGYQFTISLGGSAENPTPLTTGPVPAVRLRLTTGTPLPETPGTGGTTVPDSHGGGAPSKVTPLTPAQPGVDGPVVSVPRLVLPGVGNADNPVVAAVFESPQAGRTIPGEGLGALRDDLLGNLFSTSGGERLYLRLSDQGGKNKEGMVTASGGGGEQASSDEWIPDVFTWLGVKRETHPSVKNEAFILLVRKLVWGLLFSPTFLTSPSHVPEETSSLEPDELEWIEEETTHQVPPGDLDYLELALLGLAWVQPWCQKFLAEPGNDAGRGNGRLRRRSSPEGAP